MPGNDIVTMEPRSMVVYVTRNMPAARRLRHPSDGLPAFPTVCRWCSDGTSTLFLLPSRVTIQKMS